MKVGQAIARALVCLWVLTQATMAFAQSGTTALSGTVVDSNGGAMPGVSVVAKNVATGVTGETVTNGQGVFSLPSIDIGTYEVTVSLAGFKTSVIKDVKLVTGQPSSLKVTLEVGAITETVNVRANTEIVQTQSTNIATTVSAEQIKSVPIIARNAINYLTTLPGVDAATSTRNATINGLPDSSMAILIDGVNTQDQTLRSSDGFFSRITPNVDAIEEVTVSTATPTADRAGQGAVQVLFTTRSGTNKFSGSGYITLRRPEWNTNYWFNKRDGLPKDDIRLTQPGFRVGGPIVVPGLFDGRNKAFFFFNYEELRLPSQLPRTRTLLTTGARGGVFTSATGGATKNLLALAAANGFTSTIDPTIAALLTSIADASSTTGTITQNADPNKLTYAYQASSKQLRRFPTGSIDINPSDKHKFKATMYYQQYNSTPDLLNNLEPKFPGFPNVAGQTSDRFSESTSYRWTVSNSIVNEARVGGTWGPGYFTSGVTADQFANQKGFSLGTTIAYGITGATTATAPQTRTTPTLEIGDTINWLKGNHSVSGGVQYSRIDLIQTDQTVVPTLTIGLDTTDPAQAMFSSTNFPSSQFSSADVTNAKAMYALLTGRVTAISGNLRLDEKTGKYVYLGSGTQRGRITDYGFFLQDAWRVKPNFTLNYGVRYELQMPFQALNDIYSQVSYDSWFGISGKDNMFKPGVLTGSPSVYTQYTKGTNAYKIDKNNFAPNIGATWRPNVQSGLLRKILGAPEDSVIRGAFSMAYDRNGMSDYTAVYGGNPGSSVSVARSIANGNLVGGSLGSLPVLLRDTDRLGPAPFTDTISFPLTATLSNSVNIFAPDLQVPYSRSYSFGIQRGITKNTALEVRYVGTRHFGNYQREGYLERNTQETGFLQEFRNAQANLQANIAAGRGASLAYFGAGTGTVPLPIYLAYLTGSSATTTASAYTASAFTNNTLVTQLAKYNPNMVGAANTLDSTTNRPNAIRAGLPANFFVFNPGVGAANMTINGGGNRYDSFQVELRRRLANGFLITGNYVFATSYEKTRNSVREPFVEAINTGADGTVHHAMKVNFTWDLPFGQGRRFGGSSGRVLDAIIGGWTIASNIRIQTGQVLNFGNVRIVGMDDNELQNIYKLQFRDVNGVNTPFMLPADVIENTIKAFSTSATSATGYGPAGAPTGRYFAPKDGPDCIEQLQGDCGPINHYVTGPMFKRVDLTVGKRIKVSGRINVEARAEIFNLFDAINFTPVVGASSSATLGQVTAAYRDTNNTFDPGSRVTQLSFRINW